VREESQALIVEHGDDLKIDLKKQASLFAGMPVL
jgi:hypothetical protein